MTPAREWSAIKKNVRKDRIEKKKKLRYVKVRKRTVLKYLEGREMCWNNIQKKKRNKTT